jgi:type IV secretion system protein VirB8
MKQDKKTKVMFEGMLDKLMAIKPYPTATDYYQESRSWYSEVYESMICSRDRYRLLSIVLGVLLILSTVSIFSILPLKHYVYRIMEVNTQTGEVSELNELESTKVGENWAVTRYFISQYVQNRNAYHMEDIKRMFNLALAMSGTDVASVYNNEIVDTNPKSPINTLGKEYYRDVTILSQNQLNANTALVRFRTITHNRSNINDVKTDDFQVVIKWQYKNYKESLPDRDKNPLGFTVTYYQQSPLFTENT